MTTQHPIRSVSRRTALAGLGVALAATTRQASAQDATPAAMTGHPLVGTWIIDRVVTDSTEVPVIVVVTSDGGVIDPGQGVAGVWEPTGPRSAAWTIVPFIEGGAGGYVVVRSTFEVDQDGDTFSASFTATVVTPDGTVVATDGASSRGARLRVDPVENAGNALAGFPTWTPATPEAATPA